VVLHRSGPRFGPALWVASGLVTEVGSGAAHLLEVARSLGVPTVVGVGEHVVHEGDLVVVDADRDRALVLASDAGERDAP
jgi:phosphoenolpyruvate-protein kinase (PTS system EI component)